MSDTFLKQRNALTSFLRGKSYFDAIRALRLLELHCFKRKPDGTVLQFRKDNVTPELSHMVRMALSVTTLRDLLDEEGTIICALLHDLAEDHGVSKQELANMFGEERAQSVWLATKKFRGENMYAADGGPSSVFYDAIAGDQRTSIVKGVDRYDNFSSMLEVFSHEKKIEYLVEGEDYFLPMLKAASFNFPEQYAAYANIRAHLKDQIAMIKQYLKLEGKLLAAGLTA